jgi:ABC-type sugar transport system substrate-binding protein
VNQAITQKYDGIILSQGRDPYSTALIKKAVDAGIKVSVFDTAVNGEIPGVTVTQQDDASLTKLSFGALAKDFNGKANIIKLWVAGFPPMERRQAAYAELLKEYPGIKELESIGAVSSDVQGDTANKVGAVLAKYPKGQIDAIWGTWDAFSQGAYKALKENGRTEIKLYSIDVSNQDLQLMRESNSPWKVSVAVDPKLIGATNVRLVANKIAGEQTLRPTTLKPPPFHRRCWRRSRGGERGITGENHPRLGPDRRLYRAVVRYPGSKSEVTDAFPSLTGRVACSSPVLRGRQFAFLPLPWERVGVRASGRAPA